VTIVRFSKINTVYFLETKMRGNISKAKVKKLTKAHVNRKR
jgi:hypothetical protein